MVQKCHVIKCTEAVVAKNLCRKHYMQVQRHGEVIDTRPDDWGKREKHSAYRAWCGLRRFHRHDMCKEWLEDFWNFANDVGEKPESGQSFRPDKNSPWCKENFYWKEKRTTSEDRKEYMREWHKKSRESNKEYYLNADLKKNYGITLDWYKEQLEKQNGVCAICKNKETTKIRGKLIAMPVDHCHTTGKARGLLCTQCNRALGLLRDDVSVLESAIKYLRSFQ